MSAAVFNLDKIRAEVLGGAGLARTNRFEVVIPPPRALSDRYKDSFLASMYVEQANMPMLNIFTKSQKIFGPSYQRPITSEYGGEGIPITFHIDRNMNIKKFFEDWMHAVVNPVNFTVGYQEDYITDIFIKQIDEAENVTHEIKILEAFPRNMNLLDLNNSASNQTHRLNILFAYRYWINTDRETSPVAVPRVIVNPQIPSFDQNLPDVNKQWNWQTGTLDDAPGSYLPPSA